MTASPIEQRVIDAALAVFAPDKALASKPGYLGQLREAVSALADHRASLAFYDRVRNPNHREGVRVLLVGDRQSGKTTETVQWLTDPAAPRKRILLVRDNMTADLILRGIRSTDPDFPKDRILTAFGGPGRNLPKDADYGIDETVHMLMKVIGIPNMPDLVTISTDDRPL